MKQVLLATLLVLTTMGCMTTALNKRDLSPVDQPRVVMYSTSWCSWCKKAKAFFEANHVTYVEKDFDNPKEHQELIRFAKSIGYMGKLNAVPIFIIKNKIIVGFNKSAIVCELGLRKCIETDFIDTRHYSITTDYL